MEEGDFRPLTARRPLDRFSWNLKYITTSRTRPRMLNFRGLRQRRWSGQIASWRMKVSVFFRFFATPTGRIFGHIPTLNTSLYVVSAKVVPFGVRKIKFEIWPPVRPKNVKIGTLSWRSMENCSRPNSGTVRRIQFKLGTRIDHTSGITRHDSKVKRSKVKVTT